MGDKEEEFDLSEKIHRVRFNYNYEKAIFEKDVQEFIRLLKEIVSRDYRLLEVSDKDILKEIDKLAGSKLT